MSTIKKYFWLLATAVPVVLYFGILLFHVVNFPFYDDYQAIIESTLKLNEAENLQNWFKALLKLHNEHRIGFTRFIGWLDAQIGGGFNFAGIQVLGNLAFVPILFYFYKTLQDKILLPVVALMLFQFQSWDNAFWAMAALSNFWIYAWAFGCFYFLSKPKPNVPLAICFAVLATFTIGSGLFTFIIGVGILCWRIGGFAQLPDISSKWTKLGIWLLVSLAVGVFYLNGINESHPIQPNESDPRTLKNVSLFLFAFLGSNFWVSTSKYISIGFGVFFFVSYLIFVFKNLQSRNLLLMSILSFLMLTTVLVAWNRYLIGVNIPLSSRYRIAGTLVAISVLLGWLDLLPKKWLKPAIALCFVGAVGFNFVSNYMYFDRIRELVYNRKLEVWLAENEQSITGHYKPEEAYQILQKAQAKGIFKKQTVPTESLIRKEFSGDFVPTQTIDYQVDTVFEKGKVSIMKGWAILPEQKNNLSKILVALQAPDGKVTYHQTIATKRYDLIRFKGKPLNYIESGFVAFLPTQKSQAAKKIGIAIQPKLSKGVVEWTDGF